MEYNFKEYTIEDLVQLIDRDKVNLNPDYQRNYIWSPNDQKSLIDTILNGYPLPSFFVYIDEKGNHEMVDGQQRSKTIYRFVKGLIKSSKSTGGKSFHDLDSEKVLSYKLPFIIIRNLSAKDDLRNFYVLINKKGVHLNNPEVTKSEHYGKLFLRLADEISQNQKFIDLNLFTEASKKRMNDRAFVEELLGYLKEGIKEKKKAVENIYKDDISQEEYTELQTKFEQIIDKLSVLNEVKPIRNTRYKQKNDFYTLVSFLNENIDEKEDLMKHQYRVLTFLDRTDGEGRQFIRPTNEECDALKDYATMCVSQSNSAKAREGRLKFFNAILKNTDVDRNERLKDVINYLSDQYGDGKVKLKDIHGYQLIDVERLTHQ